MWEKDRLIEMDSVACAVMRLHHPTRETTFRERLIERAREARLRREAREGVERLEREAARRTKLRLHDITQQRDRILGDVAAKHGLKPSALFSETSVRTVCYARWEVMARLSSELGFSISRIGRFLNKHHTTVMHGLKRYREKSL